MKIVISYLGCWLLLVVVVVVPFDIIERYDIIYVWRGFSTYLITYFRSNFAKNKKCLNLLRFLLYFFCSSSFLKKRKYFWTLTMLWYFLNRIIYINNSQLIKSIIYIQEQFCMKRNISDLTQRERQLRRRRQGNGTRTAAVVLLRKKVRTRVN